MTLSREEVGGFTLTQAVQKELETLREQGELGDGSTKTEPRCYVCCEAESKDLANKLIAAGMTNREVAESLGHINARRRANGDNRIISARNVWWHQREHFNVEKPAQAAYRQIVERYANQVGIDHINGVGTAVTPLAVIHTTMLKGFFELASGDMPVNTKEMMDAAKTLHAIEEKTASGRQMADIMYMMDRIIDAAKRYVPIEEHENFLAMVEGRTPMEALSDKAHAVARETIGSFTPNMSVDESDEI